MIDQPAGGRHRGHPLEIAGFWRDETSDGRGGGPEVASCASSATNEGAYARAPLRPEAVPPPRTSSRIMPCRAGHDGVRGLFSGKASAPSNTGDHELAWSTRRRVPHAPDAPTDDLSSQPRARRGSPRRWPRRQSNERYVESGEEGWLCRGGGTAAVVAVVAGAEGGDALVAGGAGAIAAVSPAAASGLTQLAAGVERARRGLHLDVRAPECDGAGALCG